MLVNGTTRKKVSSHRRIPWNTICGARRTNGEPCKKYANYGATRCRLHGGSTVKSKVKSIERVELLCRAAVQPAIDTLIESMTVGPRRRRIAIALAVLTNAGVLTDADAAMIESVKLPDEMNGS